MELRNILHGRTTINTAKDVNYNYGKAIKTTISN